MNENEFKKIISDTLTLNSLDIAGAAATVESANGVPVAWRLFHFGMNHVSKFDGTELDIEMTEKIADDIVANFRRKGSKIPLDSRHFLYVLSRRLDVTEKEVSDLLGNKATFGFGELEKRADGLWIINVEYLPLAEKVIAEKTLRYFSPVLRGLESGIWRVTSVTFSNEPALDGLDAIAAEAAALDINTSKLKPTQKENPMGAKLLTALAVLLGMDAIAMNADGAVEKEDDLINRINGAKAKIDAGNDFLKSVGDELGLEGDVDFNAVKGRVLALNEQTKNTENQKDDLKKQVDALALDAETRKRNDLIKQGTEEGKLTKDLIEKWAKDQDSAALEAFLRNAPVINPVTPIDRTKLKEGEEVALTADQIAVFNDLGITDPEEQKKAAKL